jgi:hypothetical protein
MLLNAELPVLERILLEIEFLDKLKEKGIE